MKGYIFISTDKSKQDGESMMIQSNMDLKVLDILHVEQFDKEFADELVRWIPSPSEYRFVVNTFEDFSAFISRLEKLVQHFPRDYVRIIKSRFWNIQSEMIYRLKCPNHFDRTFLLGLYGLTPVTHPKLHVSEGLELATLANAFFTDRKTTNAIIKEGHAAILRKRFANLTTEALLTAAFKERFTLTIKEQEGIFELTASKEAGSSVYHLQAASVKEAFVDLALKKFD